MLQLAVELSHRRLSSTTTLQLAVELTRRRLSSTATLQLADRDNSALLATISNDLARRWRRFRSLIATIQLRWQRFRSPIIGDASGRRSRRFGSPLATLQFTTLHLPFTPATLHLPFAPATATATVRFFGLSL